MSDDLRATSTVDRATEILARCMTQGLCGAGGCADCDCSGQVPHEAREWAQALATAGLLAHDGDQPDPSWWKRLDESPPASAQMLVWHAPGTVAAVERWLTAVSGQAVEPPKDGAR